HFVTPEVQTRLRIAEFLASSPRVLNLYLSIDLRKLTFRTPKSEFLNYSTVSPICLAVPSIVRMALSRFVVFRSGIFVFAISSTFARETVPTFSFFGLPEPVVMPAAFFNKSAAGGITTGSGDRKSTRLNSSHDQISYAVFCLKKKKKTIRTQIDN